VRAVVVAMVRRRRRALRGRVDR